MRSNAELTEFVRTCAREKGISLAKLEVATGLSNGRIGKWPTKSTAPSYDVLIKIAELLDVPFSELVGADCDNPVAPAVPTLDNIKSLASQLSADEQRELLLFLAGMDKK